MHVLHFKYDDHHWSVNVDIQILIDVERADKLLVPGESCMTCWLYMSRIKLCYHISLFHTCNDWTVRLGSLLYMYISLFGWHQFIVQLSPFIIQLSSVHFLSWYWTEKKFWFLRRVLEMFLFWVSKKGDRECQRERECVCVKKSCVPF